MDRQQLEMTAAILYRVRTDAGVKLAWGRQVREEIKTSLSRGEVPNHYRVAWIRETRSAVVDTLIKASEAFNTKYPHDCVSTADMVDVLLSTIHALQVGASRVTASPDAA